MPISEWQCIFRSGKIFRSGNVYFGVAKHISEWQNIFRSGKAYLHQFLFTLVFHRLLKHIIVMYDN